MTRSLFVCSIGFLFSVLNAAGHDQGVEGILDLADYLADQDNHAEAVAEYQRFLFFSKSHPLQGYAYYRCAVAYENLGEWRRASEFYSLSKEFVPEALQSRVQLRLALTAAVSGQSGRSVLELLRTLRLSAVEEEQKKSVLLLLTLYAQQQNWHALASAVSQASQDFKKDALWLNLLDSMNIVVENARINQKSPSRARLLSTIVPGAGQFYSQNVGGGVNAVVLNAATTSWLVYLARERRPVDFALVFGLLWHRYYSGNRLHAAESALLHNHAVSLEAVQKLNRWIMALAQTMPEERKLTRSDFLN